MIDLVKLKYFTLAALPGRWMHLTNFLPYRGDPEIEYQYGLQFGLDGGGLFLSPETPKAKEITEFICALDPENILELIDLIERQEKELKDTQATVLAMAEAIGSIHGALGLDPEDAGGAAPIIEKIEEMQELIAKLGVACGHSLALAVTTNSVLIPMHPNSEMIRVMEEEEWTWQDLLAAAECITEKQYEEIAAAPFKDFNGWNAEELDSFDAAIKTTKETIENINAAMPAIIAQHDRNHSLDERRQAVPVPPLAIEHESDTRSFCGGVRTIAWPDKPDHYSILLRKIRDEIDHCAVNGKVMHDPWKNDSVGGPGIPVDYIEAAIVGAEKEYHEMLAADAGAAPADPLHDALDGALKGLGQ